MIVLHHMFRRTARMRRHHLQRHDPYHTYVVIPAARGPWRWFVIREAIV